MKQTIDKRVFEVLKKENLKLTSEQKTFQKLVSDIQRIIGTQSENYIIAPKDTIGKSVRYNIGKP